MSKDYKRPEPKSRGGGSSLLVGILIGLVLGLGIALGVAWYINKMPSPFLGGRTPPAKTESAKGEKAAALPKGEDKSKPEAKPRFDFYKILPGVEEPKVQAEAKKSPDRAVVDQAKGGIDKTAKAPDKAPDKVDEKVATAEPTTAVKLPERFWLQAGSFAAETDAENLKARLAFAGWQASIQQGTVPDKGTRYRVRLGPYDNTDELNRIRSDLAKSGFEVAVIKF